MSGAEEAARAWARGFEEDEIDLREYAAVLWRRRWLIAAVVAVALVAAAAASYLMRPVYRMETVLALAQVQGGFYGGAVTGDDRERPYGWLAQGGSYCNQAVATEVLGSADFLREAAGLAGLSQDRAYLDRLRSALKVEPVQNAGLVRVVLETSEPESGRALLQSMADLYARKSEEELATTRDLLRRQLATVEKWRADLENSIDQARQLLAASAGDGGLEARFERAMVLSALQGQEQLRVALIDRYLSLQREMASIKGVQVIQPPQVPVRPVRPRPALNLAVAGVLGLMAAALLAFGLEYFRRSGSREGQAAG